MKKRNIFIDILLSIFVSIIVVYLLLSFVRQFLEDSNLITVLKDFKGNIDYVFELPSQVQLIVPAAILIVTVILTTLLNGKKKGYTDAADHGAHGAARFTNVDELRRDGYISNAKVSKLSEKNPLITLGAEEGIILGRVDNELININQNSQLDNRNVLLVGSSGSGKGQSFIINNIINNRTSNIIVTDPKGELFDLTHEIKRDQGYKIFQVDFLNLIGDGFNPLDYVYDDLDAKRVALTIARNAAKDDKEDHWFGKAVELLTGLILYVKEKYDNPSISVEVFKEFNMVAEDEEYATAICEEIGENHIAYQYFKNIAVAKSNERASIMSTFTNKVGVFTSSKVKRITTVSDINFYELQEELSIIYIKIPIKDNPVQSLTATFFDQLINTHYKIGDMYGSKLKIPTIFLFDEFANIGKINEYDNTLSTCRGYEMSIITVIQDFAQLDNLYGDKIARTIISNHDTHLFLKTKDTQTAKYYEELAGDTTIRYTTSSGSKGGGLLYYLDISKSSPSHSENEQLIKKPLVSKTELLQMNPKKAYAFFSGKVLPLDKAYQGVIYKDFITGSKKEKDQYGISRFPYVYPQNRDKYIEQFKLKPYEEIPQPSKEVVKEIVVETPPNDETLHTEPLEVIQSDVKDNSEKLDSLISNFINKVQTSENMKKEEPIVIKESKENELEIEKEQLFEMVIEESKAAFDEDPSREALNELKNIISLKEKVEVVTDELNEAEQLQTMANFFKEKDSDTSTVETIDDVEVVEIDLGDELPI